MLTIKIAPLRVPSDLFGVDIRYFHMGETAWTWLSTMVLEEVVS